VNENIISLVEDRVKVIQADSEQLAADVEACCVVDQETNEKAAEYLGGIKARLKRVDELRKELTQPLNDQIKKINNMFRPRIEDLKKIEEAVKAAICRYMDEQEHKANEEARKLREQQEAEQKKAQEEAAKIRLKSQKFEDEEQKKKLEEQAKKTEQLPFANIQVAKTAPTTVRTQNATISQKKVWCYTVIDEALLRKKRPEFFILDEKALSKYVREVREETEIDGIKIYQKSIISAR